MDNYSVENIKSLSTKDAMRSRVEMYLGAANMDGVYQAVQEIISNSVDEFLAGYGKEIRIYVGKDYVSIGDDGRGVPIGKLDNGEEALVSIFMTAHTGGKFDEKAYGGFSAGLNGIGGKAVCLTSSDFKVVVKRDGAEYEMNTHEGDLVSYKENRKLEKDEKTGTFIYFKPSPSVYKLEPIEFDFEKIKERVENLSFLTAGLSFILVNEVTDETITYSSNGLTSLLEKIVVKPIHDHPMSATIKEGDITVDLVAQWTEGREMSFCFTNGIQNYEGGTPITGIKSAITRTMNSIMNTSLSGETIRKGLVYAVSIRMSNPSFSNQTKSKINNNELRSICGTGFSNMVREHLDLFPNERLQIISRLVKEEEAQIAAEKVRQAIFEATDKIEKKKSSKGLMANKLSDCRLHGEESTLFIVEGDSAKGAIVPARDGEIHAVMPLRGKLINALKQSEDRILQNAEVLDIQVALGIDIGEPFNIKKLRYGKIAIWSDADYDGYSIMCLVLTFFFRYYPELIRQEKLVWVRTPLFCSQVGKGKNAKRYYSYSEEETKKLPKGELKRFKGIGEMSKFHLLETVLNPKHDKNITFSMKDKETADIFFNMLMGEELDERRDFIAENCDYEKIDY